MPRHPRDPSLFYRVRREWILHCSCYRLSTSRLSPCRLTSASPPCALADPSIHARSLGRFGATRSTSAGSSLARDERTALSLDVSHRRETRARTPPRRRRRGALRRIRDAERTVVFRLHEREWFTLVSIQSRPVSRCNCASIIDRNDQGSSLV